MEISFYVLYIIYIILIDGGKESTVISCMYAKSVLDIFSPRFFDVII